MRNGGTGVRRKQREARMRIVRAPPGAPPASPQHQAPPGGLLHTEAVDIHTCALPTIAYTKIVAASAAGKGSQRTSLPFVYKGERGTRSLSPCKGWAVHNGHCKQLYKKKKKSKPPPTKGVQSRQVPLHFRIFFFFTLYTRLSFHAQHTGMQGESATTTRQYTRTHTHYTSTFLSLKVAYGGS